MKAAMRIHATYLITFVCLTLSSSVIASDTWLYWTDSEELTVNRINVDGTGQEVVIADAGLRPQAISVDPLSGMLFWSDVREGGAVYSATIEGEIQQEILNYEADDIAVDPRSGKIYGSGKEQGSQIVRSNYDGTELETLVEFPNIRGISLDLSNDKMYWLVNFSIFNSSRSIQRSDLDGSNEETVTRRVSFPETSAVSPATNQLFWVDSGRGQVMSSDLDGNNIRMLARPGSDIRGIAYDPINAWVYWTDRTGSISRISSDGENEEVFVAGLGSPRRLALLQDRFGDFDGNYLLDALDIDKLTESVANGEYSAALDLNNDKVAYHADRTFWVERILRTNFGDANLDREFNSSDLVAVFEAGEYEDGVEGNSGWAEGDWNGDTEFSSADLVTAFQVGSYEQGPLTAVAAVPEPSGLAMLSFACLFLARYHRSTVSC